MPAAATLVSDSLRACSPMMLPGLFTDTHARACHYLAAQPSQKAYVTWLLMRFIDTNSEHAADSLGCRPQSPVPDSNDEHLDFDELATQDGRASPR